MYSRVAVWREGRRAIRPEVGARGGRGPRRRSGGSFLAELCRSGRVKLRGHARTYARRRTGFVLDSQVNDIEMSVCVRYAETCFVLDSRHTRTQTRTHVGVDADPADRHDRGDRVAGSLNTREVRRARTARAGERCSGRSGVSHKPSRFTGLPTKRARLAY